MNYYLGIDQSKRSTGCVLLDEAGELVSFTLIHTHECDNEDLIIYQFSELASWLHETLQDELEQEDDECRIHALIEGLAFGAVGSGKDFLAGLQWYFRARFKTLYGSYLGTVPVTMWRSKILTREETKMAKYEKNGLKEAVVCKLPENVRSQFANYVEEHRDTINRAKCSSIKEGSKSRVYESALYDLADAFFIAKHRHELSISK